MFAGTNNKLVNDVIDQLEETWKVLDQFLPYTLHPVLVTDGLPTSHPVSIVVNSPDEINAIFDSISYKKG